MAEVTVAPVAAAEPSAASPGRPEQAARALGQGLKRRLAAALAAEGPAAAVRVCSIEAPGLAREIEAQYDVRVGRSSLRLRNPRNVAPDWVGAWLTTQGERQAAGVSAVHEPGRPERFLAPIVVEPLCLTCHGPVEAIPAEVRAALSELYPDDRAVGYAEGDLRGALWAETR